MEKFEPTYEEIEEIENVRGTLDVPPEQMARFNYVIAKARETFHNYGYSEIRLPILEYHNVYLKKSGSELRKRMYVFEDLKRRKICLRPEVTASVARAYAQKWRSMPKPLKLYYIGPSFRYDEPQMGTGRLREFYHLNVELIGSESPASDAELITTAVDLVKGVGLNDAILKVGHLGFLFEMFNRIGDRLRDEYTSEYEAMSRTEYLQDQIISRLDSKGEKVDEIRQELADLGLHEEEYESVVDLASELRNLVPNGTQATAEDVLLGLKTLCSRHELSGRSLENLKQILRYLEYFGINKKSMMLAPGLVRGLTYYTGMVFQIEATSLGAEKEVCGGGRYDNLMEAFSSSAEHTPALGFAFGLERLTIALENSSVKFPMYKPLEVYVIPVETEALDYAINVLQRVRRHGFKSDFGFGEKTVKGEMSNASTKGVRYVLIIGPKEKQSKTVTVRNMIEQKERMVPVEDAISMLEKANSESN